MAKKKTPIVRPWSQIPKTEQWTVAIILLILSLIMTIGWMLEAKFFDPGTVPTVAAGCKNPKNINTPYCQQQIARQQKTWKQIRNHKKGAGPQFNLW
jgi:hypothetical protein